MNFLVTKICGDGLHKDCFVYIFAYSKISENWIDSSVLRLVKLASLSKHHCIPYDTGKDNQDLKL